MLFAILLAETVFPKLKEIETQSDPLRCDAFPVLFGRMFGTVQEFVLRMPACFYK